MLTIQRSCSYRIITRALQAEGEPLVGLIYPGAEDCDYSLDPNQLESKLASSPDTFVVYNQQSEAQALVENLQLPAEQVLIEIRQDTKGVLGLHAMRRKGSETETLELIYQE